MLPAKAAAVDDEDTLDKKLAQEVKEAERQQLIKQKADRDQQNQKIESNFVRETSSVVEEGSIR